MVQEAALALVFALGTPIYDGSWAAGLRRGVTVHLPAGRYVGPWRIGAGIRLIAEEGAILGVDPAGGATLSLEAAGIRIEGLTIEGAPGGIGISAKGCAGLSLLNLRIRGGRRGIEMKGGDLTWTGGGVVSTEGFGLWAQDARLDLRGLRFRPHAGSGLFIAGGVARVRQGDFAGGDYGVLLARTSLTLAGSRFGPCVRAGLALVGSAGQIRDNRFDGPYGEAAITALRARPLQIERNTIGHVGAMGVKLVHSEGSLSGNRISGARPDPRGLEGDGLYLFDSEVDSKGDRISDIGGNGIVVLGGRAKVLDCSLHGVGDAAVFVDEGGRIELDHCEAKGAARALAVEPGSSAKQRRCRGMGPHPRPE